MVSGSCICSASPEQVFARGFQDMKWDKWDPGMNVQDITGPCQTGTTCTWVLKDGGMKLYGTMTNVVPHELIEVEGYAMGGLMKFTATFVFKPLENNSKTQVTQTFDVKGLLGPIIVMLKGKLMETNIKHEMECLGKLMNDG